MTSKKGRDPQSPPHHTLPQGTAPKSEDKGRFFVIGLGASAGGLGALEEFFENMPPQSGLAFVVVTHQHPGQTSLLAELLSRKTKMPVFEVSATTSIQPNCVYTVRPGYNLSIVGGVLHPLEVDKHTQPYLPVDYFFRSLAQDQKERAVGIVLSGTGSDGSQGLKEIKGELGMVMAQEEQTAQYSGMPHSAIATELVDYALPVAKMPAQLLAYIKTQGFIPVDSSAKAEPPPEALQQIILLIRNRTGHDFSQYKKSTINRRIERRLNVHQLDSVAHYAEYLQKNPTEVDLLFKELLIGVTSFFRDSEAWEALSSSLSTLISDKPDDYVIRAWVAGCATGEEAYSLAILLHEVMESLKRRLGVQIFATDLDAAAIEAARSGNYPAGIANDVSPKRLSRFFISDGSSYRVKKELREMLIFAPQNLIADPPFTKVDILCCRNLLIYLEGALQRKLLPLFHYSLKPKGILFLGSSESIGPHMELFSALDKKWKIFRRREVVGAYTAEIPAAPSELSGYGATPKLSVRTNTSVDQSIDKMLLRDLVPPTVVVQESGDVVYIHGRTGLFLEPAQGNQSNANILDMARDGLRFSIPAAIRQAATGKEVLLRGVQLKSNGDVYSVDVRVLRLKEPESLRGLYRISFEQAHPLLRDGEEGAPESVAPPDRLLELERELQYARESHQGTTEELETANEELETSKEEMQSLNEELQTVNAELQGKVDELSRANNDMKNLLNATDIATLFLDNELRIRRYTEQTKQVIRLIPTDVGRPIGDLVSSLRYGQLVDDAREVLHTLVFKESAVQSEDDKSYLMRILPYRTVDNVIDGLVLTFVDVTKLNRLQGEKERLLEALRGSLASVIGQDKDLKITWASSPIFGKQPAELIGKSDEDLFDASDAARLREVKSRALAGGAPVKCHLKPTMKERKSYDFYIEPKRGLLNETIGLTCLVIDVTQLSET